MTSERKGGRLAPGVRKVRVSGPLWSGAEKPRDFRQSIRKMMRHVGRYRYLILLGTVLSMISAVLGIFGPQLLRQISDTIFDGIGSGSIDTAAIGYLGIATLVLYGTAFILTSAENYIIPVASEHIAWVIRTELFRKISRLPMNYFDNSSIGDIMSRMTNDADTIGETFGNSISSFLSAVTLFVGCIVLMVYTSPILAVATIIPTVAGFLAIRVMIRCTHRFYVDQSRNLGRMNGLVEETYYGHEIVAAYSDESRTMNEFESINAELCETSFRSRFVTSMLPQIMNFTGNLNYVIVCVLGSILVMEGQITYGVIVAFIVYVRMFNTPLLQLTDALASMQSLAAASERAFDLLDAPEMEDETEKTQMLDGVRGEVDFRDVAFS